MGRCLSGVVTFDYSNNDGNFDIGAGELRFATHWSRASEHAIHCYRSGDGSIALVRKIANVADVGDATQCDTSSRTRTPSIGEFVVIRNKNGYHAAIQILKVLHQDRNGDHDPLTFAYWILPDRSSDFSRVGS